MKTIKCNVSGKSFEIKKQAKWSELPNKSLEYFTTAFTDNGIVDIYHSKTFALYAKPAYLPK